MPDDNKQTPTPEQERTIEERVEENERILAGHCDCIEELEYKMRVLRRLHGDNIPEDRNHMHACLKDDEKLVIIGSDEAKRLWIEMEKLEHWQKCHVDAHVHEYDTPPHDRERAPGNEPDIERLAEVAHTAHFAKGGRYPFWKNQDEEYKDSMRGIASAILKELGYQGEGAVAWRHLAGKYWLWDGDFDANRDGWPPDYDPLSGGFHLIIKGNATGPFPGTLTRNPPTTLDWDEYWDPKAGKVRKVEPSSDPDPSTPPDDKERTPGIEVESPAEKR